MRTQEIRMLHPFALVGGVLLVALTRAAAEGAWSSSIGGRSREARGASGGRPCVVAADNWTPPPAEGIVAA